MAQTLLIEDQWSEERMKRYYKLITSERITGEFVTARRPCMVSDLGQYQNMIARNDGMTPYKMRKMEDTILSTYTCLYTSRLHRTFSTAAFCEPCKSI